MQVKQTCELEEPWGAIAKQQRRDVGKGRLYPQFGKISWLGLEQVPGARSEGLCQHLPQPHELQRKKQLPRDPDEAGRYMWWKSKTRF
jgi:hypothetical protein